MADLHTATLIADVDLLDTVEFPVRKAATAGLLRGTFAKLKTYLKAGLKVTDFSDVDISTPPADGQVLVWNATTSKFKPGSVASGGGGGGVGATPPSVVQSKAVIGNQPATDGVMFDTNVTPGNLIVALSTHWGNNPAPSTGWLPIANTNGASASGIVAVMKVATSADVGALIKPYTGGTAGQTLVLFEIAGALPAVPATISWIQEVTTATPALNGASGRDASLVVGFMSTAGDNTAPSAVTGVTTISELQGVTTNESPRQITTFKKDGVVKGAVSAGFTYAAASKHYGILVSFAP